MSELALIGDAYHRAARLLVDDFSARNGYNDLDAYPIVYLYRHSIELMMKAILTVGNKLSGLLGDPRLETRDIYTHHSLARNIKQIKRIFEAVDWTDAFEQAGMGKGEFERVVEEFEQIDASSMTFRYPITKDGRPSLAEKHFVFSPINVGATLDPIIQVLSGACSGLEEHRQMLAEARAEMAAEAHENYCSDY